MTFLCSIERLIPIFGSSAVPPPYGQGRWSNGGIEIPARPDRLLQTSFAEELIRLCRAELVWQQSGNCTHQS
jgi:hypothetical protein